MYSIDNSYPIMQLSHLASRLEKFITNRPEVTITKDTFTRLQFESTTRLLQ